MRLIDADALYEAYSKAAWYDNMDRDDIAIDLLLDTTVVGVILTEEVAAPRAEKQQLKSESKGCEYCTEGRDITPYDLCRAYVDNGMLKWDGVYKYQFDINFCPMCGRKLKGE